MLQEGGICTFRDPLQWDRPSVSETAPQRLATQEIGGLFFRKPIGKP